MNILFTTDYYWPHLGGGVEVVVQQVAERLAARGHTVTVLTLNTVAGPRAETVGGVQVVRLPAVDLTRWVGLQLAIPNNPFGVLRVLRTVCPDVIHANNRFFILSLLAALFHQRLPLLLTLHLGPMNVGPLVGAYERVAARWILSRSDAVTAVSVAALQVWPAAELIPNGVDTERFRPTATKHPGFRVAFVGRLIRNKGPHRLLEAIPYLDDGIGVDFLGDGPMRDSLLARAQVLGVAARTRFLGVIDGVHRELPKYRVLVRPSDTEGMSLAVLEALACGLPVIASPKASSGLVDDGVNGFVLPEASAPPEAIASFINRLHREPQRLATMADAARQSVLGFSWDNVTDAYERRYEALAERTSQVRALSRRNDSPATHPGNPVGGPP